MARNESSTRGYWLQRFTPRKAKEPWSNINRDKAKELIAAGLMEPLDSPGRAR